jgi:hypothetical protein
MAPANHCSTPSKIPSRATSRNGLSDTNTRGPISAAEVHYMTCEGEG